VMHWNSARDVCSRAPMKLELGAGVSLCIASGGMSLNYAGGSGDAVMAA